MPRGQKSDDGTIRVAPNGYSYVKQDGKQVLLHHIIAGERRGRPVDTSRERVVFIDRDRTNLNPDNLLIVARKRNSRRDRITFQNRLRELAEEYYMFDGEAAVEYLKELALRYDIKASRS
jgi:hypothetical protein